ncbi:PAS domain-containing sensor histidine kinase [Flaviaesturariibacter amylovorans]|uniref:histidine kinase n=1 Tax=Flaviaesturariibacter amylovorans TaxID=1084520 RepID=A0ABP8GUY0_9BACT
MTPIQPDLLQDRYQMALEAAGFGIIDNNLEKDEIYCSDWCYELYGLSRSEVVTLQRLLSCMHPDDALRTRRKLAGCMDPDLREPYENEYRIIDPASGTVRSWVKARGKVYFNDTRKPVRLVVTVQDITAEIRGRGTRQKLITLVENSIELMSVLELDGRNSYINKAGMEMLGFDNFEQVLTTPISDLHEPEDIAFVQANVLPSVMQQGRWSGAMRVRHLRTGEVFHVFNNTVRIDDPITGEPIAIGAVMRDMRPELEAQRALAESERNFRALVMQAPVGMCILAGEHLVFELANERYCKLLDVQPADLLGRRLTDALPRSEASGVAGWLRGVLHSGMPFSGQEFELQYGGATRYVDFVYEPLRSGTGSVEKVMVVLLDVTEKVLTRRRLEESERSLQERVAERTEELLRKNKELEEYAYVTSHDLQEPLRKIRLFAGMIREQEADRMSPGAQVRINKVIESAERMSNALSDLLHFSSLTHEEQSEDVDLEGVLRDVCTDLELLIGERQARIEIGPLPVLRAVRQQMHQVFYNLLSNALKFAGEGKVPEISVTVEQRTPSEEPAKCWIRVRDNGIGFSPENREKIFGLFQRLHARHEFQGSGIGLALCRKAVQSHGGMIYAESTPGEGATFYVGFPLERVLRHS